MPLKLIPPDKAPKGRYYYVRGTYRGIRIFRSLGTDRRKDAEREVARIEREIEEGRHAVPQKREPTFSEAALSYLKNCPDSTLPFAKKLLDYFRDTPLSQINQASADLAAAELYPNGAPGTLNRNCLTPLAAILHHAAERDLCQWIRVRKRKEPKGRVRWLEPDEAARLIECAGRLRPLVVFLFSTGARLGEALKLTWADVDLDRKHIVLRDTKNGETYGVALIAMAADELRDLNKGGDRVGLVFGYHTRSGVYKPWRAACKAAGIRDFSPHDCRHTYATWLRQGGQDMVALQRLGRWKDQKSVARYAHVSSDEMRAAVEALPIGKTKSV